MSFPLALDGKIIAAMILTAIAKVPIVGNSNANKDNPNPLPNKNSNM